MIYQGSTLMKVGDCSSGKLQIDWPSRKGPFEERNADCVTLLNHAIKDCLEGSMCSQRLLHSQRCPLRPTMAHAHHLPDAV